MPFAHRSSLTLLLISLFAPRAEAQSVDPRLFDTSLSPGAIIGLDSTWIPAHLQGFVGVGVVYANDELVLAQGDEGDPEHAPLHTRWITTLGGGLGLFDRLELQLGLTLHKVGELPARDPTGEERLFGIGDLRIAARGALVRPEDGGLGLVVQLGLFVPSGGEAPFSGDDGVVFDPRVVVDWRSDAGIAVALQVGYRSRPERRVFDLGVEGSGSTEPPSIGVEGSGIGIDDELRYGLGVEVPLAALGAYAPVALLAEIEGALGFGTTAGATDERARQRPVEARLGARIFGERWALTLASGAGLNDGYGAPDLRFVAIVALSPGPLDGPRELPRRVVATRSGAAPAFSEPPDLSDRDVFDAALAGDPDADGDRVTLPGDRCAREAEDRDGFQDDDGCPDPDNDSDGVPDAADKCPGEAETPNGVDDGDGCPDEGESSVVTRDGIIELSQTIEFHSGSDVLLPSATPIIAEVAAVLKANQAIRRVRIEGHTDGEGDEEMNVDLSERRAGRVRQKLVELGVAGERLLPKGYGATRAVASNHSPEGRKKNRRVEFRVVDPPPAGSPRLEVVPEGTP